MAMINRSQLVEEFAGLNDLAIEDARKYLDSVLGCITKALANGHQVTLHGFGVFRLRHRAPRTTTNPATGQPMVIEAADVPTFRSSPGLRKAVNEPGVFM